MGIKANRNQLSDGRRKREEGSSAVSIACPGLIETDAIL